MIHISDTEHTINKRLHALYPEEIANEAVSSIIDLIFKYKQRIKSYSYQLTEKDVILISYGDQITGNNEASLKTLYDFMESHLQGIINSIHILPFYPSSSDDGFSVVNYSKVDPKMGSWREVELISGKYRLMVDAVINHVSQYSDWFKAYLNCDHYFKGFFIEVDPSVDLSKTVRPRNSPLLNLFIDDNNESHHIWTTFSRDQVDLNYKNYRVLINVLDALFYYIEKGATLIRFDAIAFIWKELGTQNVNLPQTHELIQLMREVLHEVAPDVIIITETNVPHHENVSYFGSGDDEAQMVYNFALPPLLLHSILHGDTLALTKWAQSLTLPSHKVCFFNFTARHNGIDIQPAKSILSDNEMHYMVNHVKSHGGLVSYKTDEDGSKIPYELNCSYIDALTHPDESDELRMKRMLVTQATVLAMPGIPGIYFHSLVGSRNYKDGVKHTGINRTINREKYHIEWLENELSTEGTLSKSIFDGYTRLISIRNKETAFNPFGEFNFLDIDPRLFVFQRFSINKSEQIIVLHNFSNETVTCTLDVNLAMPLYDITSSYVTGDDGKVSIKPYQILWLKPSKHI